MQKNGVDIAPLMPLIDYFLDRSTFYRSADRSSLVLNSREGWRIIDIFYPFEVMRVGLQNVLEAFCALGYGDDERLQEAWSLLEGCEDGAGRIILGGHIDEIVHAKGESQQAQQMGDILYPPCPEAAITFVSILKRPCQCGRAFFVYSRAHRGNGGEIEGRAALLKPFYSNLSRKAHKNP
jgi:hypothetical protein